MCGAAMEHTLDVLSGLSTAPLAPVVTAPRLQREGRVRGREREGGKKKNQMEQVGGAGRL